MPERAPVHLSMVIPPGPWTGALEDGTVGIPGVSWECIADIDNAPDRFVATKQYDVGENGIRRPARDVLGGSPPIGIPVFFGREHMQRNIIVRDGSSIVHASDLAGKRIGTWLSIVAATTVGVMLMLEQGYSVPLADIEWNTGDPKKLQ